MNGCRSGWNRRIFYTGGGGWVSAAREPNASGRQREEVVRRVPPFCIPECEGSASVSVFYLAWCQPPSLFLHAGHALQVLCPALCVLGHLYESQGEHVHHTSVPEPGWQSWQHWRKTASGIKIPALFWIWGRAWEREQGTVYICSEVMLKPDAEGHCSYKSNDRDLVCLGLLGVFIKFFLFLVFSRTVILSARRWLWSTLWSWAQLSVQ